MSKKLDWEAHKWRKASRPLLTKGELKDYQEKARQLAERVKRGKPSANAKTSGPVRVLDACERAKIAAAMGLPVAVKP